MNIIRTIAENSGIILVGRILKGLINLIITISLAKYLGKTEFGNFSFLLIFFYFFTTINDLWINPILIRELANKRVNTKHLFGNSILMKVFLSIGAFILFCISIRIVGIPIELTRLVYFVLIGLLSASILSSYELIFLVSLKMKYYVRISLSCRMLSLVLIWMIIYLKGSLLYLFGAIIFSGVIELFIAKNFSEHLVKPKFEIDFVLWRKIFKEAWPLALTVIFVASYHRIDQLMLFKMKGPAALGSYSVVVRLTENFSILPVALMMSILPLMSKYFKISKETFTKTYQLSFRYLMMSIVPIAAFIAVLSKPIVVFFYGKQFLTSDSALAILIWAQVFVFMGIVNSGILVAANKQKIDPVFTGTSAIINVALNLALIPKYNFAGAAAATLISYGVGPLMGYFIPITRAYSQCMFQAAIKPFFASIVMAGFIYRIYPLSKAAIISAPFVYLGILVLIGGVKRDDVERLRLVVSKRQYT